VKADPLKCGECGCETFKLASVGTDVRVGGEGAGGFTGSLIAMCTECKVETTIAPAPARLVTDGTLCGGWA
jgi:hypothetical protein